MKTTLILILITLLHYFNANALANEPTFTVGQTFQLRLAGVPAMDAMQVTGTYTISDQGTVALPFLKQEIPAVNLTPSVLQKKITAAYIAADIYVHPTVVVQPFTNGAIEHVVTVGGEVKNPSEVPMRPGLNLFAAISRAAGPTEYAKMSRVKLLRGKTERIYDLRKVTPENNPILEAGDQIVVPAN